MSFSPILISFLLSTALFALIPGPAMLFVAAKTSVAGRRAGLTAALGIHVGCGAHILAASIGLPVLFHHYPALYHAVRLAGAAYLVWLGCGMIRRACLAMEEGGPASPESFGETFRQSAIVEMLNPKTGIFFLTQLPLYADPAGDLPLWQQFLLLGVVVNLIFSLGDLCGILFAGTAHRLCSHAPQRRLRQGSGLLIAGIGLSIVVATC